MCSLYLDFFGDWWICSSYKVAFCMKIAFCTTGKEKDTMFWRNPKKTVSSILHSFCEILLCSFIPIFFQPISLFFLLVFFFVVNHVLNFPFCFSTLLPLPTENEKRRDHVWIAIFWSFYRKIYCNDLRYTRSKSD